jgi:hypothetical protein
MTILRVMQGMDDPISKSIIRADLLSDETNKRKIQQQDSEYLTRPRKKL